MDPHRTGVTEVCLELILTGVCQDPPVQHADCHRIGPVYLAQKMLSYVSGVSCSAWQSYHTCCTWISKSEMMKTLEGTVSANTALSAGGEGCHSEPHVWTGMCPYM